MNRAPDVQSGRLAATVLVADRDQRLRDVLAEQLRARGHEVQCSSLPSRTWAAAPFVDVVVLGDCLFPGETAKTLAASLREAPLGNPARDVAVVSVPRDFAARHIGRVVDTALVERRRHIKRRRRMQWHNLAGVDCPVEEDDARL